MLKLRYVNADGWISLSAFSVRFIRICAHLLKAYGQDEMEQ